MQNLRASMAICSTVKFTNGSGGTLTAEQLYKVEDLVGVVVQETINGAEGVLIHRAPSPGVLLPKTVDATGVFAAGDNVYYDATAGKVVNSTDKSGNIWIGQAVVAAVQADTTVQVDLDGATARGAVEA